MTEAITAIYLTHDEESRELIRTSLQCAQKTFYFASEESTDKFKHVISEKKFDVALIDAQIPGFRTEAFVSSIHKLSPEIPIIILSREADNEAATRALAEGCIDFIISNRVNLQNISLYITLAIERHKINNVQRRDGDFLLEAETRFRDIFENATDAMLLADISSRRFILSNDNFCTMLGYSKQEILNLSIRDIHPEDSLFSVTMAFDRLAAGEIRSVSNIPMLKKDGSVCYVDINSYHINLGGGKYIMGIFRDVTERKRTGEKLEQSEAKYKKLSDEFEALLYAIPDKITLISPEFKIIWLNKAATETVHRDGDGFVGKYCYTVLCGRKEICEECPVRKSYLTGLPESVIINNDYGSFIDVRTIPIKGGNGEVSGVIEISRDITHQKLIENELRENEAKFRAVADTSIAVIAIYQNHKVVFLNAVSETVTGYSRDELLRMNFWDIIHPDFKGKVRELGVARLQGLPVPDHYEFKIVTKNGQDRWLDFGIGMIQYEKNQAVIGIAFDITERKETEEALKLSEKRYRQLHDSISDAFVAVNMDGRIIECNNSFLSMTGYSASEIVKLRYEEITPSKWRQIEEKIITEQVIRNGFSEIYEKEYIKKDGTVFPIELSAFLIRDEEGKPQSMWALIRDITSRKNAEKELNKSLEQMRHLSARLRSIREDESKRIAREIHDEIGQTLTGIKMDLAFLEDKLTDLLKPPEYKSVQDQISSISNLTDSAVHTIRRITTELRPVILDSLGLSAAIEWQAEDFEHRTGVKCRFTSTDEKLEIDPDVATTIFRILQEALTNIMRHAKASGVKIVLEKEIHRIFFQVSDNGIGFDINNIDKLNSFGILGMRERAELIGGVFEIESLPRKGTTIRITLPLENR